MQRTTLFKKENDQQCEQKLEQPQESEASDVWPREDASPPEKKVKLTMSPPTSEDSGKMVAEEICNSDHNSVKDNHDIAKAETDIAKKDVDLFCPVTHPVTNFKRKDQPPNRSVSRLGMQNAAAINSKELDEQDDNITAEKEKIEKPKTRMHLFDYLGDEVSIDELQVLQEMSGYWLSNATRNRDTIKEMPPEHQGEQDFYSKYCDEEGKLSITATTYLMSLPHVVAVFLKSNNKIEVIVSNREKALQESEELRQNHYDVVEAKAMHLM